MVFFVFFFADVGLGGTSYTWNGGDWNWTNSTKWTPNGFPGDIAGDDTAVFIASGGIVTISTNITVNSVDITGSADWTWTGSKTVTVNTAFNYGSTGGSGGSCGLNVALAGGGILNVTTGTLNVKKANSHSGGTFIGGYLDLQDIGGLGTDAIGGTVNTSTGGTLRLHDFGGAVNFKRSVTFDGGTYSCHNGGAHTGTWTVVSTSYVYVTYRLAVATEISGAGKLIHTGSGTDASSHGLRLCTNNTWTGGLEINSGMVQAWTNGALGQGSVTVSGGILYQGYYNTSVQGDLSKAVVLNGGLYASSHDRIISGNISLITNSSISSAFDSTFIDGIISEQGGSHSLTICDYWNKGDNADVRIRNSSNSYSGGTYVQTNAHLRVPVRGGLGTGAINVVATNSYLYLDGAPSASWSMTNDFGGCGEIDMEGGSGTYGLIVCGRSVTPGTNGYGSLRVDGDLDFETNGPTRATLSINVLKNGGVATNTMLSVDHDAGGFSKGDLMVAIDPSVTSGDTDGREFTILTCTNDVSSQAFNSVSFSPSVWTATTQYGNGYVKLVNLSIQSQGTVIGFE